jgi:diketogulonate reductase-like aldo/keto reductase
VSFAVVVVIIVIRMQPPWHDKNLPREPRTNVIQSYLIHAPFFSEKKEDHQAKWAQMEQVKASGLARSIGVSNYLPEHLDWILETAQTPPSINQIEFHPYLQHGPLIDYHKQKVGKHHLFVEKNEPKSTDPP